MAAMKARRPGRYYEAPRERRHRAPPPPPPKPHLPRLAHIKLARPPAEEPPVSGRSLRLAMTGVVLFLGAGIAAAAWLGSSLFDLGEAFARGADSLAANVGFEIGEIDVVALAGAPAISAARAAEVRALIVPEHRRSILALDPGEVKARVESIEWVAGARVRRLWPSALRVEVERSREYALWEEEGQLSVIDMNGERLAQRAADHTHLPRVVGAGAGPAAESLLLALEGLPQVRARLVQLVRVGDRRWNAKLQSGTTVALPEEGAAEALARLEALHAEYALLDRPIALLDLRTPGRLSVRVHPGLAGGLRPLLEAQAP